MSERNTDNRNTISHSSIARALCEHDTEWVEIFKDRVAEDLKRILQEDMEWSTSRPILERLNRLRDIEEARLRSEEGLPREEIGEDIRKAS